MHMGFGPPKARGEVTGKKNQMLKNAENWLPGLIVSAIFIVLILYFVDLHQLVDAIRQADLRWLAVSVLVAVTWLSMRGVVWRALLRAKAPYHAVFLTLNEGYLLNNFLPLRLGELGRAFLLSRKTGLTFMEVLPTVVMERVLDLAFSAIILLSAIPFVAGAPDTLKQAAYVASRLVVVGLFSLYLLARNHVWALGVFEKMGLRWPILHRFGGLLKSLFEGLALLTEGWLFLRVLGLMAINWSIAIVQFLVILLAFFPKAQVVWAMFGLGAAAFGGAIPALPGGVGTFEGVMGAAVLLVSGDEARSFAAAIVTHLLNYLVTGIIGIYALSREGQTLSGVYQQLSKFRKEP
jgi:glycosyltransferase 2 family protein